MHENQSPVLISKVAEDSFYQEHRTFFNATARCKLLLVVNVVYCCNHKPPTVNQQQVGVQQPDAQQIADSSSNENQKNHRSYETSFAFRGNLFRCVEYWTEVTKFDSQEWNYYRTGRKGPVDQDRERQWQREREREREEGGNLAVKKYLAGE